MSDLISRQDFDKFLKNAEEEAIKKRKYVFANALNTIRGNLREFPSAEPERKNGKWIVRTRHEHFPSGKEYTELVCPFCGRTDHNGDGCYCGYCGAKMEVMSDAG